MIVCMHARGGTSQKFGWLEPRRAEVKPQNGETSRDELFSSLKLARRAEMSFLENLEWRDEPRRVWLELDEPETSQLVQEQ